MFGPDVAQLRRGEKGGVVFDGQDLLLTASYMDYARMRADNGFMIFLNTEASAQHCRPMEMVGRDDVGSVGALAAAMNAVWGRGVRLDQMPFTPQRVWEILRKDTV